MSYSLYVLSSIACFNILKARMFNSHNSQDLPMNKKENWVPPSPMSTWGVITQLTFQTVFLVAFPGTFQRNSGVPWALLGHMLNIMEKFNFQIWIPKPGSHYQSLNLCNVFSIFGASCDQQVLPLPCPSRLRQDVKWSVWNSGKPPFGSALPVSDMN